MKKSIKMRLYVDESNARVLDGQMRIANFLYNHLLETANQLKKDFKETGNKSAGKTLYSQRGLRDLVPGLKDQMPFLKTVYSSPLKNVALRLSESITAYRKSRKGQRKGKKTGWPKFRSHKRKPFSLLYEEPFKGYKLEEKHLRLSLGEDKSGKRLYAFGEIESSLNKFKKVKVKQLRITQELGEFFAIFTVDYDSKKPLETSSKIIAIDPNHKNLGVGVSNEGEILELANLFSNKALQKRIDSLKSKRDRCQKNSVEVLLENGKKVFKPSKRWSKFNNMLEKVYRLRREQTKTYLYTHANYLFKHYDVVAIGDYTPKGGGINSGMRRQMNNESQIGRFKKTLKCVGQKSRKSLVIWPERNSTKQCADCGYLLPKALKPNIRHWHCPKCGKHHDRDVNAAQNGLKRVLSTLGQTKTKMPSFGYPKIQNEFTGCAVRWNGLGLDISSRAGANPSP